MQRILAMVVALALATVLAGRAGADETRLVFTTISLPGSTISNQVWHPWADRVNAAGQGAVHVDVRDGFTLASRANYCDRLHRQVVDAVRKYAAEFRPAK